MSKVGAQVTCSIASGRFGTDPEAYFVLGTAFLNPDEREPMRVRTLSIPQRACSSRGCRVCFCDAAGGQGTSCHAQGFTGAVLIRCGLLTVRARWQGRLLMLQARGGRLHLVAEKEVQGAVYTLSAFQARLTPFHVATRVKGIDLAESLVEARR